MTTSKAERGGFVTMTTSISAFVFVGLKRRLIEGLKLSKSNQDVTAVSISLSNTIDSTYRHYPRAQSFSTTAFHFSVSVVNFPAVSKGSVSLMKSAHLFFVVSLGLLPGCSSLGVLRMTLNSIPGSPLGKENSTQKLSVPGLR